MAQPTWPKGLKDALTAGLFALAAFWLFVVVAPEGYRVRFQAAGDSVAAIAALAAAGAAFVALRQLDLQRASLEEQAKSADLARFDRLRSEYASWVEAAYDLATIGTLDRAVVDDLDERASMRTEFHRGNRERLVLVMRAIARLRLLDRDRWRGRLCDEVATELVKDKRDGTIEELTASARGLIAKSAEHASAFDPGEAPLFEKIEEPESPLARLATLRGSMVTEAGRALRASIAKEEAASLARHEAL